jgi:hypothetical protein
MCNSGTREADKGGGGGHSERRHPGEQVFDHGPIPSDEGQATPSQGRIGRLCHRRQRWRCQYGSRRAVKAENVSTSLMSLRCATQTGHAGSPVQGIIRWLPTRRVDRPPVRRRAHELTTRWAHSTNAGYCPFRRAGDVEFRWPTDSVSSLNLVPAPIRRTHPLAIVERPGRYARPRSVATSSTRPWSMSS